MSLKMKLTSTIAAFLLILGLTIMGVMAAPSATVNLGGSISFTATGVNAKVTGSVADYGNDTEPELKEILFQAEYSDAEKTAFDEAIDSWKNCDLVFKSTGSAITITVTIENLADRVLFASVNSTLDVDNVNQSMAQGEDEYTGDIIEIGAKGTTEVDLILEVDNKNASVSGNWGFDIDLMDVNGINSQNISNLSFTVLDEEAKTASVSMKSVEATSGDIVIPSYVIINPETGAASAASATSASENLYKVTTIPDYAFFGFNEITADPDFETAVENEEALLEIIAKYTAVNMTSLILPNTIESIGNYAFGYTGLEIITIPESVTIIGNNSFAYTTSLESLIFTGINPNLAIGSDVFVMSGLKHLIIESGEVAGELIAKPEGVGGTIKRSWFEITGMDEWDITNITLGNAVIGEFAFYGCSRLTSVTILDSVTEIVGQAFTGCTRLTTVVIDSATVASGLTSQTSMSNLVNNATTIYIKTSVFETEGFVLGSYVSNTTNFPNVETITEGEYAGYTKYSK